MSLTKQSAQTALYRFYGKDGELLYVGITHRLNERLSTHKKEKPWQQVAKVAVEHFLTRSAAEAAEIEAIRSEKPQWNVMHNSEPSSKAPNPWETTGSDEWEKSDYLRSMVWRELHLIYPDLCNECRTRGGVTAIKRTSTGLRVFYDHCGLTWHCYFSLDFPVLFGAERAVAEVIEDLFPPDTAWTWSSDFFAPVRLE